MQFVCDGLVSFETPIVRQSFEIAIEIWYTIRVAISRGSVLLSFRFKLASKFYAILMFLLNLRRSSNLHKF